MTDDRKAGVALIGGSLGGLITMAIHPSGTLHLNLEQVARLTLVSGIAHSIAILSVVVLFLGVAGLHHRIAAADRLSFAAIVTFALACITITIAASVSGFIVPRITQHMAHDDPANAHTWQILVDGIFQINQAFARIYSVAASAAIMLWSVSALKNGGFSRSAAIYGCTVMPLLIVGVAIGHLALDVHGMAVIWLAQAIWFIGVGGNLCSRPASTRAEAAAG